MKNLMVRVFCLVGLMIFLAQEASAAVTLTFDSTTQGFQSVPWNLGNGGTSWSSEHGGSLKITYNGSGWSNPLSILNMSNTPAMWDVWAEYANILANGGTLTFDFIVRQEDIVGYDSNNPPGWFELVVVGNTSAGWDQNVLGGSAGYYGGIPSGYTTKTVSIPVAQGSPVTNDGILTFGFGSNWNELLFGINSQGGTFSSAVVYLDNITLSANSYSTNAVLTFDSSTQGFQSVGWNSANGGVSWSSLHGGSLQMNFNSSGWSNPLGVLSMTSSAQLQAVYVNSLNNGGTVTFDFIVRQEDIAGYNSESPPVWFEMFLVGNTNSAVGGGWDQNVASGSSGYYGGIPSGYTTKTISMSTAAGPPVGNDNIVTFGKGSAWNEFMLGISSESGTFSSAIVYLDNVTFTANSPTNADVVGAFVQHFGFTGLGSQLDPVKSPHEQGTTPTLLTFNNLINSSQGINGIVFDVNNLGNPGALSASDFVFQMSPTGAFSESGNPPSGWVAAPAPISVSVVSGTPSRITIQWSDNAIANRWLRTTILANARTGLAQPEVYFIGHLRGETVGPDSGGATYTVSFSDITPIRSQVGNNANSGSIADIDKNGVVAFADISAMRGNVGAQLTNITVP